MTSPSHPPSPGTVTSTHCSHAPACLRCSRPPFLSIACPLTSSSHTYPHRIACPSPHIFITCILRHSLDLPGARNSPHFAFSLPPSYLLLSLPRHLVLGRHPKNGGRA
ncbi:hypothetical protein C8Q74DRAFT_1244999 [Fomes fomentarius]|nr:hypothetical protein C8Q74DRAFT_1244999 [Fomes fomentarius]